LLRVQLGPRLHLADLKSQQGGKNQAEVSLSASWYPISALQQSKHTKAMESSDNEGAAAAAAGQESREDMLARHKREVRVRFNHKQAKITIVASMDEIMHNGGVMCV